MKIILQNGHAISTRTQLDELMRTVYLIADGWHQWAGPDPADPDMDVYFADRPADRELIEKSYVQSAGYQSEQRGVRIECTPEANSWTLDIDESVVVPLANAHRYLGQSLSVVVENSRTDGAFLKQYLGVVDGDLADKMSRPDSGLSITHAGGKAEMLRQLEAWLSDSNAESYPKRMILVFDSDAAYEGHANSATNGLVNLCNKHHIPFHALHRRAIENYVTDRCLTDYAHYAPDVRESVAFITSLSSMQRCYYPFKAGCPVDSQIPEQRALYANTEVGHGDHSMARIADYMLREWSVPLTRADLAENGSLPEIEEMAAKIMREM